MKIFILNSGGSSAKFKVFEMPEETVAAQGGVERIGKDDAVFKYKRGTEPSSKKVLSIKDHQEAIQLILDTLADKENGVVENISEIKAAGHRVVHGGEKLTKSVLVDEDVISVIESFADKAPLHNPPNLTGIRLCQSFMGKTPQVAVFDHALHKDIPDYAYTYGIPYFYYEKYGIRKYGFHGLTFKYMTERAANIIKRPLKQLKIVSLMLGSGCTANAMKDGTSIDVSTGFTPFEGLVQSTRAGDVDAAAVTYLMKKENISPEEMEHILNKESGWYGVSGVSNDMREILDAMEVSKRSRLAVNITSYRAKKYIGAYAAALGGIDLLVFAGGVGENVPLLREKICSGLEFLGVILDKEKNRELKKEGIISFKNAPVSVVVVNTDEEIIIAREVYQVVSRN